MPETFIEPHKVLSPLPKQNPANVSLENVVTGKRRSKPVKPVKKQTKKRAKKGGEY